MTIEHKSLVALHRYACNSGINESWASANFLGTFKEATKQAGFDDYEMGVTITWYPEKPETMSVCREGIAVTKYEFKELAVQGELARLLLADLQVLATKKMEKDILAERSLELNRQAQSRVAAMMVSAVVPDQAQDDLEIDLKPKASRERISY